MKITGRTRIIGIFGYPVEHTLSPAMHNAAFEHLGLDYCYLPFLVRPEALQQAVEAIRALSLRGVNITVPHKEAVIPLLDEVSSEAAFIGAVNTVVNKNGILTGYNTDGRGFMLSLSARDLDVSNRKILMVGAGGAARAVSYYLSDKAKELVIYNRGVEKLEKLVADLSTVRANVSAMKRLCGIEQFDIIVNATSLGLHRDDPLPVDPTLLAGNQIVCDLIYRKTPLLTAAEKQGCTTVDGLGMLLYQGVLAFELWTEKTAPAEVMKKALLTRISQ
ncbi:MAG: shikimate dehydrogenase [Thermodesulfovibrio sp.]|nr:shikimate dehydrogenase [Thermodesulfovibrio sp.]